MTIMTSATVISIFATLVFGSIDSIEAKLISKIKLNE